MTTRISFVFAILAAAAASAGCEEKEQPQAEPAAKAQATSQAQPSAAQETAAKKPAADPTDEGAEVAIEWQDPADWKRVQPKSRMRKASYEIPAAAGDKDGAEMRLFYFGPNQGGGVDQNIKRWVGQFEDLKEDQVQRSERSVNDLTQHIVEVKSGTYSGTAMGPHAPKKPAQESQGLLGAVIEAPTGKYFFKLTGPSKTVQAARDSFFKLLDSVKAKSG